MLVPASCHAALSSGCGPYLLRSSILIPDYAATSLIRRSGRLFPCFRIPSMVRKHEKGAKPLKTPLIRHPNLFGTLFTYISKIPLLSEPCNPFLRSCTLNAANQLPPGSGGAKEKPRQSAPANTWHGRQSLLRFDQSHDDPFDGPTPVFALQIEPADQTEQIVGKKTPFQPGFVRRKPMTTCFVPAQRVLALLYPVFNVASAVVHLDHLACRKPGIGHDEIVPGERFAKMPFDFGDHPAGLVPVFCLVRQVHILDLHSILRWTTDRLLTAR